MVRQPQQAGHGAQRQRLAGNVIHFRFETVIMDLFKLRHLMAGAGVNVGAGPDGVAVAIVKHDTFAHRTAGDRGNIRPAKLRPIERLADALAGQPPVGVEIELHRAGDILHAQVLPFRLADGDLPPAQVEDHGTNAASPCI